MAFDPISTVFEIGSKIIDRVIPDKNAAREAKEELAKMRLGGDLTVIAGQLAINKIQAGHKSIFVSGARPATLWICNIGLLFNVVLLPFFDIWLEVPVVDPALLYPILGALLGIGGMRSFDKKNGVAREQ